MGKYQLTLLQDIEQAQTLTVWGANNFRPLDEDILAFTSALSAKLLSAGGQKHGELVALGFWLRKANINKRFSILTSELRKPLGLVVHYTPTNVDTMFVYSWVCSLITGNRNVVRLSSALSELQRDLLKIIFDVLNQSQFESLAKANQFVQYDRTHEDLANFISQYADGRILWGGDESVLAIKQLTTKPRCRDISFADRFSACVIQGDALDPTSEIQLAERLYRDLSPFEQQACSSPKLLFWLGAKDRQKSVFEMLGKHFDGMPAITLKNEQLVMEQSLAAEGKVAEIGAYGNVKVIVLSPKTRLDLNPHVGQFVLWCVPVESLKDLIPYISEKLQTLTYWGVEKNQLLKLVAEPSITGIDRVVPIGQALAFEPNWDGYSLVDQLTRKIEVQ